MRKLAIYTAAFGLPLAWLVEAVLHRFSLHAGLGGF